MWQDPGGTPPGFATRRADMAGIWVLIIPKLFLFGLLTWGTIVARRQAAEVEARRAAAPAAEPELPAGPMRAAA